MLDNTGLEQTIIFSTKARASNILLERARHNFNSTNIKVIGGIELAKIVCVNSCVFPREPLINNAEQLIRTARAARNVEYFKGNLKLTDAEALMRALNLARRLCAGAEREGLAQGLKKGSFQEKNEALIQVYDAYMADLAKDGVIDSVALMRMAIDGCKKPLSAKMFLCEGDDYSPLEMRLFEVAAGVPQRSCEKISLSNVYLDAPAHDNPAHDAPAHDNPAQPVQPEQQKSHPIEYLKCYGANNEVQAMLDEIYACNIPLDNVTVALTKPAAYLQLLLDVALEHNIPMTFDTGVSVVNSNAAQLLELYLQWSGVRHFSHDALRDIFQCPAFNYGAFMKCVLSGMTEVGAEEKFRTPEFLERLFCARFTNDSDENSRRMQEYRTSAREAWALNDGVLAGTNIDFGNSCSPLYLSALDAAQKLLALPIDEFINKFTRCNYLPYTDKANYADIASAPAETLDKTELSEPPEAPDAPDAPGAPGAPGAPPAPFSEVLNTQVNIQSKATIVRALQDFSFYKDIATFEDYVNRIFRAGVCSSAPVPGALHITSVSNAATCVREHLFVLGLSAKNYPGTPRENHLLLDEDILNLCNSAQNFTSFGQVKQKTDEFLNLINLAKQTSAHVHLLYSHLDAVELKENNPSSVLLEVFRRMRAGGGECNQNASMQDFEHAFKNIGYFDPRTTKSTGVGLAYIQDVHLSLDKSAEDSENVFPQIPLNNTRGYSPSRLETFMNCPRRYFLQCELGLDAQVDADDSGKLTAIDIGNMAHKAMEVLGRKKAITKQDFMELIEREFDIRIAQTPALVKSDNATQKLEFLDMLSDAFDEDPRREILASEEGVRATHEPSGVCVHGFPDRVEIDEDGKLVVIDFKTGRKVMHEKDDVNTCLQTMIYAYILEARGTGTNVAGSEYRYLRTSTNVTCEYNEFTKEALAEKLTKFKDSMQDGVFEIPLNNKGEIDTEKNGCQFCMMGEICQL